MGGKIHLYATYKRLTSDLKTHTDWKWRVEKHHVNGSGKKKSWDSYTYIDKIDLKQIITRDKEGHYIMIEGSIQQEDITIVSIYAPNIGASKYIKQILTDIKGEMNSITVLVGDYNTPLTSKDRSSR